MEINALLQAIETGLPAQEMEIAQQQLQEYINFLINNDFERLVQLLYTIDVDEKTLKNLLQQQPGTDAAQIITNLMIQRQLKKAYMRQQFKSYPDADREEEERW